MKRNAIDTNVIIRFLVEDPATIDAKFKGVYSFFSKLEKGEIKAELVDVVMFQSYFVLTSYYEVPSGEAAEKLLKLVEFKGLCISDQDVVCACLDMLKTQNLDIVDAYILAWSKKHGAEGVYSFDNDFDKRGLKLLKVQ